MEIFVSKTAEELRLHRDLGLTLITLRTYYNVETHCAHSGWKKRVLGEIKPRPLRQRKWKKRFALRLRFAGRWDCLDLPPGVTVRCFRLSLPRVQEIEILIKTATLESFQNDFMKQRRSNFEKIARCSNLFKILLLELFEGEISTLYSLLQSHVFAKLGFNCHADKGRERKREKILRN